MDNFVPIFKYRYPITLRQEHEMPSQDMQKWYEGRKDVIEGIPSSQKIPPALIYMYDFLIL